MSEDRINAEELKKREEKLKEEAGQLEEREEELKEEAKDLEKREEGIWETVKYNNQLLSDYGTKVMIRWILCVLVFLLIGISYRL